MSKVKILSKSQITILEEILNELKLETDDYLTFSFVNETIFLRKKGQTTPCCACNATGKFEGYGLPCFICDQTAYIEKHEEGILFFLLFKNKFRKYNVGHSLLQHEVKESGIISYFKVPKLVFRSNVYPVELLNKVQDKLQMILVEEYVPKSLSDSSKFMIPNDVALNEMLDFFTTVEAKKIVNDWFRLNRIV